MIAPTRRSTRIAVPAHPLRRAKPAACPARRCSTSRPRVLRGMRDALGGAIPLVGVGGILSGADAAKKIDAGASLVQFYTGMIYRGPALIGECVDAMRRRRKRPAAATCTPIASTRRRRGYGYPIVENAPLDGAQHLPRARARARCWSTSQTGRAAGTVRLRDAAQRPGARARRRQQHPVRARSGRAPCSRLRARGIRIARG